MRGKRGRRLVRMRYKKSLGPKNIRYQTTVKLYRLFDNVRTVRMGLLRRMRDSKPPGNV